MMGMVFYRFRIMYGIAILMFGVAVASLLLRWHGRLFTTRWFLRSLVIMAPSGVIATLGGWYFCGNRPATVGHLRTPSHFGRCLSRDGGYVAVNADRLHLYLRLLHDSFSDLCFSNHPSRSGGSARPRRGFRVAQERASPTGDGESDRRCRVGKVNNGPATDFSGLRCILYHHLCIA
jgi:hypothetical protein